MQCAPGPRVWGGAQVELRQAIKRPKMVGPSLPVLAPPLHPPQGREALCAGCGKHHRAAWAAGFCPRPGVSASPFQMPLCFSVSFVLFDSIHSQTRARNFTVRAHGGCQAGRSKGQLQGREGPRSGRLMRAPSSYQALGPAVRDDRRCSHTCQAVTKEHQEGRGGDLKGDIGAVGTGL